jgi:hypothetical protein
MRRSVDLPIPFGPTTPIRAPGRIVTETPSRTGVEPWNFEMSEAPSVAMRTPEQRKRRERAGGWIWLS